MPWETAGIQEGPATCALPFEWDIPVSTPPLPHAFHYPLKCPALKAAGRQTDKVLGKLLVVLGGVTLNSALTHVMNQVQHVRSKGEPRKPEDGACLGPDLESRGVSF